MGLEDRAYIALIDKELSSNRSVIENATRTTTKVFTTISELLKSSEEPTGIFIDLEHTGSDILADTAHHLKERWPSCPSLLLTTEKNAQALIEVLSFGIDDFLRKPLNMEECSLRMRIKQGLLSRDKGSIVTAANILVDPSTRSLKNLDNGQVKFLSPIEVNLLSILFKSMGQSISREMVKQKCWGTTNVSDNALNRKLFEVRHALTEIGSDLTIKTLYGSGYAIRKKDTNKEL